MATIGITDRAAGAVLCTAQNPDTSGGGVASTNVLRRKTQGPAAFVVTNVDGGSGTIKVDIQGSLDGSAWFNVPYALVATPNTFVVTQLTITTAATTTYLLQTGQPAIFLRALFGTNTGAKEAMTVTAFE
jgi:hypothetical protein